MVNSLDLKAYYRYASDGKFTTDIYFTEASKQGIKIEELFGELLPETAEAINRPQDLFQKLLANESLLFEKLSNHKAYNDYLQSNDLIVNDVILYMKKLSMLDEIIMHVAFYLSNLIYIFTLYFWFKWRLRIYILSGLIYLVLVIDSYMSGIFLDAFFPLITKLNDLFNFIPIIYSEFTYEDHGFLSEIILPTIREAALTFIIFDTVVQTIRNSQKKKRRSKFLSTYLELEHTIEFLGKLKGDLFVKELKTIDIGAISQFCKEDRSDKYLLQTAEIIDEYNKAMKTRKVTVVESAMQLTVIRNNLRKSAYFRNNIIC